MDRGDVGRELEKERKKGERRGVYGIWKERERGEEREGEVKVKRQ